MPPLSPTGSHESSGTDALSSGREWLVDARDALWRRSPDSIDFDRHYPRRALNEGVQGRVVVEGLIRRDGRLEACRIVVETPEEYGFGEATLRVAAKLRVKPVNRSGANIIGARLRIPLVWRVM